MKLLLTMKLSDRSMKNHIYPITKLDGVDKIIVVRDRPGEDISKVEYLTPSHYGISSPVLMVFFKLFFLFRSSLNERPALVHSYLLAPHGYLAFFIGKLTGRKVGVSLIAGPVETYIFGGSPIGKYAYCNSLPKSNIIHRLNMVILKRCDVITVTGTFTENYLINQGINREKIWILPHVVDERFRPMDIKRDYDLIFVGRLVRVKHIETMIRAISIVKETLPLIKMVIVGEGEERKNLEELTRSLGLVEQIDFVGYQENIWEWYNRCKISLLASEREGFPYTVIESLRCGIPVIVSNCGDVNDIVKDSFNGRIVPDYRDYHAYAEVIIELLNNPVLLDTYSKNSVKSFDNNAPVSVESIWDQILTAVIRTKGYEI